MRALTDSGSNPQRVVLWSLFGLLMILGGVTLWLFYLNIETPVAASWGGAEGPRNHLSDWFDVFQQGLIAPATMGVLGTLIVLRRPGHRVGALLISTGVTSSLLIFAREWAVYGIFTRGGDLPGAIWAAWVMNWLWIALTVLMLVTAALFPDGRLPSRRWGWLIGLPLGLYAVPFTVAAMFEGRMSSAFQIANPLGSAFTVELYSTLTDLGVLFMPVAALTVLVAALVRFRYSQELERHQMKWLLMGVAVMVGLIVVGLGLYFGLGLLLGARLVEGAMLAPAVGVGVALLRHRLYDVDILIRRTLQYSLLSGVLALTYFALVTLLQAMFGALSAQDSDLSVVFSTLAIAALFLPVRARVQTLIDRRFYRGRYNAQQVLSEFATTCRDETDLSRLTERLGQVVSETMQPEAISLWLTTESTIGRHEIRNDPRISSS